MADSRVTVRSDNDQLVALGVIVRPHGIHGELRVKLYNPDSDLLLRQSDLVVRDEQGTRAVRVTSARMHRKNLALLRFEGCSSRTGAESFRSCEVCVPRSVLPPLPQGEYYHIDLIGLSATDREGSEVGVVEQVMAYPAADVLRIRSDRGVCEVPILDPYLLKIDVESGVVVVDHLEDLEWEGAKKPG